MNLFLDKYASISDKFTDPYINDRIDLLNKLIQELNQIFNDQSLFRHQSNGSNSINKSRSKNFNIKYVDTLFVGLLNLFRINPTVNLSILKDKILSFKEDSDFIDNHISKSGSSEPKYVEDRVRSSIQYFKTL